LSFSEFDRVEHARRMGWLCDQVVKTGCFAIADFVCPTPAARTAFEAGGKAFTIWVDRFSESRFDDTNRMFVPPEHFDLRISADGTPDYWVEQIARVVRPIFDPKRPTALFIGRYQPFHDGHKALITEGLKRVGQACVAVRDTAGTDANNPFDMSSSTRRAPLFAVIEKCEKRKADDWRRQKAHYDRRKLAAEAGERAQALCSTQRGHFRCKHLAAFLKRSPDTATTSAAPAASF
jgi:hypothetical protein